MKRALVFALGLALSATGARADDIADCEQSSKIALRISACSKMIKKEQLDETLRAWAYLSRGNAYEIMGKFDSAILNYTHGIRLNPKDVQGYMRRGVTYIKKGDNKDKAIADFQKVLEIDPSNSGAKAFLMGLEAWP